MEVENQVIAAKILKEEKTFNDIKEKVSNKRKASSNGRCQSSIELHAKKYR